MLGAGRERLAGSGGGDNAAGGEGVASGGVEGEEAGAPGAIGWDVMAAPYNWGRALGLERVRPRSGGGLPPCVCYAANLARRATPVPG